MIGSELTGPATGVVDVGAGAGFLGDFLAEQRPDLEYGFIEPLESLEAQLTERFGAEANRRDRDFAGFSHVVLLDVLEHQGDDRAFLAELAEKMDPGATLLLTVPAMPTLWSRWDLRLGHFRRYTRAMLSAAVEPLPFELRERSYLFPELVPLGWWRRLGDRRDEGGAEGDASFPQLSRPVNQALYRGAKATTAARRIWPAGTSLFAVLRRSS